MGARDQTHGPRSCSRSAGKSYRSGHGGKGARSDSVSRLHEPWGFPMARVFNTFSFLPRETAYQTLRVVNGMPSSVYSSTITAKTFSTLLLQRPQNQRRSSAGTRASTPRSETPKVSRSSPLANPFENAFKPLLALPIIPSSQPGSVVAPLNIRLRKALPAQPKLDTSNDSSDVQPLSPPPPIGFPQTVRPESIDGDPFPTINLRRTPTVIEIPTNQQEDNPSQDIGLVPAIHPTLFTLERAASVAIFFETLYHALLKAPRLLDSSKAGNYAVTRELRRLALEEEMTRQELSEAVKNKLRQEWLASETAALRDKRKRVDIKSFTKLKTIGHGAFGVVSLVKEKETGKLFAMKEVSLASCGRLFV